MSKEQYRGEWQIGHVLRRNYGMNLKDFTILVNETYENVPEQDIISVHERISEEKIYCVVNADNFDGDYPNESFVSWVDSEGLNKPYYFHSKEKAEVIANAFNSLDRSPSASRYYKVVEKNYKLGGKFEP